VAHPWHHNPIGVYLMSCYAYEGLDSPFLSDADFDQLGRFIEAFWDDLEHRHKHLIDRDRCAHTSGVNKPYHEWPLIILGATHQFTKAPYGPIWQKAIARLNSGVDDLI